MTIEQAAEAVRAMVADWRNAGQIEHAEHLRRSMWALLGPYIAQARAFGEGLAR